MGLVLRVENYASFRPLAFSSVGARQATTRASCELKFSTRYYGYAVRYEVGADAQQ
jgi:hypothetical protein